MERTVIMLIVLVMCLVSFQIGFSVGEEQEISQPRAPIIVELPPPQIDVVVEMWSFETFQGQPCFISPDGEWYYQRCADGSLIVLHEWERWTDGMLFKIAGY